MTPEREQQLRESVGVWAEGAESTAFEVLDSVAKLRAELQKTELRADHNSDHIGKFNEDIRKILRKAGFPDLPAWLKGYQTLQAENETLKTTRDAFAAQYEAKSEERDDISAALKAARAEVKRLKEELPSCHVCLKPLLPDEPHLGNLVTGTRIHAYCEKGLR